MGFKVGDIVLHKNSGLLLKIIDIFKVGDYGFKYLTNDDNQYNENELNKVNNYYDNLIDIINDDIIELEVELDTLREKYNEIDKKRDEIVNEIKGINDTLYVLNNIINKIENTKGEKEDVK